MWILFVFYMSANQHDGKAIATAQYATKGNCEKALTQIKDLFKNSKDDGDVTGVCTYQGDEE